MRTIYLKAQSRDALLAGLAFVPLDDDGEPLTCDARAGWDLDIIPPGSVIAETRALSPEDDLDTLDLIRVRNPQFDPDADEPGDRFIDLVVKARSTVWHANLRLQPGSTVEPDPTIICAAPNQPYRRFA